MEKLLKGKAVSEQEIGKHLLQEVVGYADFFRLPEKNAVALILEKIIPMITAIVCDNCLHPRERFDAKKDVLLMLKLVMQLKEQFKSNHIVNVLTGNATSTLKTFKHHKLRFLAPVIQKIKVINSGIQLFDRLWLPDLLLKILRVTVR